MRRRHAVIVDDERLARRELRTLLEEGHAAEVHVVGEAVSVEQAARMVRTTDADLVFLDITLGQESGFDLLPQLGDDVDVVFVTAHDQYAVRAFEVNALDYLLKPVVPERLAMAVQRLTSPAAHPSASRLLAYDDRLFLRLDGRRRFVRVGEIMAIEAASDDSYLHLAAQPGRVRAAKSLREWEERLPGRYFVRIHRSTIVNLEFIERVDEWSHGSFMVLLRGGRGPFAMSRRYGARVRSRLG
jgi:two-component system LytT family response regulator